MFEKEAGFAETQMLVECHGDYSKKLNYKKGWQQGAEYGYKKGLERQICQTLKLYKENRKLKASLSDEESLKRLCDKGLIAEKNGILPGKLSKAKDIVQTLVNCIRVLSDLKVELTDIDAFLADAEEFLKEDESCN